MMGRNEHQELRTIWANLELAHRTEQWIGVDRAVQRLAEFLLKTSVGAE